MSRKQLRQLRFMMDGDENNVSMLGNSAPCDVLRTAWV